MTYTVRSTWDGHGTVGFKVTVPVPVAKYDENGDLQDLNLSTISTITAVVNAPSTSGVTHSISQSAVAGEEHIALLVIQAAQVTESGKWEFDVFIDGEPVTPRYQFFVEPAP